MATSSTWVLQVIPFHNCESCIRKVRRALRHFGGLRLIEMNLEIGKFTISTVEHPEAIRAALQQKFRHKSSIFLSKKNPHNLSVRESRSCGVSREAASVDFQGMTGMLMTLPQAERIQSVECKQDVLRVNYYEKQLFISEAAPYNEDALRFLPPPRAAEPSAPPLPVTPEGGYAYGYPFGSYGDYSTAWNDDNTDCCCYTIM